MRKETRPPWRSPAPKGRGEGGRLTPAQKAAARERAAAHGRRYPNLVDNMWAVRLPRGGDASE